MTSDFPISADNNRDEIGRIVESLTQTVEKEVNAFQSLLNTLLDQQASILKGDPLSVSLSNQEVERIVSVTRELARERLGKSKDLSRHFDMGDHEMSLSTLIPMIENRYALRLEEMKKMLHALSEKIKSTNQRNQFLLERSLQFVDSCLHVLVRDRDPNMAYGRDGNYAMSQRSMYSGTV